TIIGEHAIPHAFYLGGGSAPLLSVTDLTTIASLLDRDDRCLVANNFFSADFVAFTPAAAIHLIDPPPIDNDLAYRLQRQAGLRNVPLARSAATQMDVDTPTDLLVLANHPGIGRHLRELLQRADLDFERLRIVARHLTDPTSEVIVSGRVGSHVLAILE